MRLFMLLLFAVPAFAYPQDPAPAQDGFKLEASRGTVGDKFQVAVESDLDLDITIKDSEPERTIQLSQLKMEQFQQEVVAGQNGAAPFFRVKCLSSSVQRSGTYQQMEKVTTELEGQTFLVKSGNSSWKAEMPDGSKPSEAAGGVGGWEAFERLLPADEVKVGAKWNVEKEVSSFLSVANLDEKEKKEPKIEAALKSVEGAIATITFTGSLEGKTKDGASIRISIASGEMVFDRQRGRPVTIHLSGEMEAVKDVMHEYQKPGSPKKTVEKIGEIRSKSRKLEVRISFQ